MCGKTSVSSVGLAPGEGERSVRIGTQAQCVALAVEAVIQSPGGRAALDEQQQEQPVAVAQARARIARLDRANGGFRPDEIARNRE